MKSRRPIAHRHGGILAFNRVATQRAEDPGLSNAKEAAEAALPWPNITPRPAAVRHAEVHFLKASIET
ncbi:hypothetical protein D3873_02905 [Paenisporosarcina cavernae]|uniref:Uncharacterized protein n=1 Tax=Paenisporosarcina cavernae TaxID=2320858 RepID=A0A385YQ47_9BACL|nr:hypothetical protein D3873_02905 [Paenisporosarcina cavernae]